MKPQNRRVIITQEKSLKDEVKVGNQNFILDNAFRTAWNTIQEGIVHSVGDGTDLQGGDKVYVHHFVSESEHKLPIAGGSFRWLEYSQVYGRIRNNELKMLNNYLFVSPVSYSDDILKSENHGFITSSKSGGEFVERMGIVAKLSDACREAGLNEGDIILFNKNCEYQIEVDGEKFYRMELRDVITTIDKGTKITSIKV